jgi:hypothetical protein
MEVAEAASEPDLVCGACGYNLRGVPSERCPECGRVFGPDHTIANLIPWEQRNHIGRPRAFVKTVYLASFRPRQIASKMDRPVSRSSAQLFHAVAVLIAAAAVFTVPATLLNIWRDLLGRPRPNGIPELYAFVLNNQALYLTAGAVALWLVAASALVGVFSHPASLPVERQNRALAISHYAAAPLIFFALLLVTDCSRTTW